MRWIKTQFPGVRYREHPTRKHGIRKDRYFALHYKVDGRVVDEKVGWASEGVTAESAYKQRLEIKDNKEKGTGPVTLREQRAENEAARDAEAAQRKAKAQAEKTLSEYWDETYFPAAQRSKKPSSWSKEEQHFTRWISPLLGKMTLKTIGLKQWDELVKVLSAAELSQRSKEYITGTLRRILRHAYDRRMVDDGPPTGKRIGVAGPGNNRRLRVISHEDESAILKELALRDTHAWRITRFAFLTGCRASEAFNLVWGNIDHARGCIVFADTKNRDSRTIPITEPLAELLNSMTAGPADVPVFVKEDGSVYQQAPYPFQSVVDDLGLNEGRGKRDRLVFHSIRHSVATRLAQRLGPRDLMDVMGWRTVQMAMRYVHGNEAAKAKALATLGTAPEEGKVLPFRGSETA